MTRCSLLDEKLVTLSLVSRYHVSHSMQRYAPIEVYGAQKHVQYKSTVVG